jgi:hypothetical protein
MESNLDMNAVLGVNPEEQKEESLIEQTSSVFEDSLLNASTESVGVDTTSMFGTGTESVSSYEAQETDYNEEIRKKQEEQRIIDEHNKRVRESPEFKAQVVFNQYVQQNPYMSGKDKRRLLRECLKNAKKGKYDYLFDEEKIRKREERQKEKFDKLNKPKVHTVEELSDETRATLEQMADADVVPPFNKETGSFEDN